MKFNYFQPIYLEFHETLTRDITGFVMPFPNLETFKTHYDTPEKNAPTNVILNSIRLLLPQIRVVNNLTSYGQPNPAAFLAYQPVDAEILSLLFRKWVEACYSEANEALTSACGATHFQWTQATPEQLEFWAPSWAIALKISQHDYQIGDYKFKFLFAPGRSGNAVELVSFPPDQDSRGHRASISIVISTQSDIDPKKINLHFGMKRWIVRQGEKQGVDLQKGTTHCYVRRLRSWLGDYTLLDPNAFTILEANYRREGERYVPQWKSRKLRQMLESLSVEIPDISSVLKEPANFIETIQTDILIPARSYQKAGWGTGLPFADERTLLEQIQSILPEDARLTAPWQKVVMTKDLKTDIRQRFKDTPAIARSSQGELPDISPALRAFLSDRATNITVQVRYRTEEIRNALGTVAQHYFGDSLTLDFQPSAGLSDPISEIDRNGVAVANTRHIQRFGTDNRPDNPTPIIVEILAPDHPNYRGSKDPKSHIKSILPKYNLVPQCIVSCEKVIKTKTEGEAVTEDADLKRSIYDRALSTILDAILPFNLDYPLSQPEDQTVYAGFYIIRRNEQTAHNSFCEPVLVVIHQNAVRVMLPARDLRFRTMPDAICELAQFNRSKQSSEQVINNMLNALIQEYSGVPDIYLFVHSQNARPYWKWLQDSKFDPTQPPTTKIHIIRIRDRKNYEVAQGYGLSTEQENFDEGKASFAQGFFLPPNYSANTAFTQTVLSLAQKASTNQLSKQMSRFETWTSRRYEVETDSDGNKINKRDPLTGKCIEQQAASTPARTKSWKAPQPRAHNILATPSPEKFMLHHTIAHDLRTRHWWTSAECEFALPLSLAEKLKEWAFNDGESAELEE